MNYRRKFSTLALLVLVALCIAPAAFAQQLPLPQPAPSAQQTPASSAAPAIPSYPDSPAGLEKLINDMMKMQKGGDAKNLATYTQSLILPNPNAWFSSVFGNKLGKELADAYDRTRLNLPLSFPDTLAQIQSKHLTKVAATLFTDSCNQESTNAEYRLLISRTNDQPLYHVRLSSGGRAAILGFFAYVDGAFRYIRSFQISTPAVLRAGENVMAAKLVQRAYPRYPEQAKYSHVSGTVVFHAIIGADGRVCSLDLVEGPAALVGASLDAVRQWRYSPTMLKGHPVSIDTTISFVFTLGN